jgi:hypothetical protein
MAEPVHDEGPIINPEVRYERTDVNFKSIVWFGVAMIVSFVVIQAGLWWMLKTWRDRGVAQQTARYGEATSLATQRPSGPQLEGLNPLGEMRRWRDPDQARLHSYGWVDRRAGVARIPIDRAMELVAAEQSQPPSTKKKAGGDK